MKKASSLIEIIVALGIFMMVSGGITTLMLGSLQNNLSAQWRMQANFLVEEGLEATRSIRDENWQNLLEGSHGLTHEAGHWEFLETEDQAGFFTRTVMIENNEDEKGYFRKKKATCTVSWPDESGQTRRMTRILYLTDWNTKDWLQTREEDFASGTLTDLQIQGTGEEASLVLAQEQAWTDSGGGSIRQTSDTDFNGGTFTDTEVLGKGEDADIELTKKKQWTSYNSPVSQHLYGISMISPTDGWIVGDAGKFIRWEGSTWEEFIDTGITLWKDVEMLSSTEGWAVGSNGKIRKWNGTTWSEFVDTGSMNWNGLSLLSNTEGWVVGTGGRIYKFNGTSWSLVASPVTADLYGIDMVSSNDGWAVGMNGKIVRWNGSQWIEFMDTGNTLWNAVFMVTSNDGWIVGNSGEIRHWDGNTWTAVTSPTTEALFGIQLFSPTEGWAMGGMGKMLKWDGVSWAENVDTGSTRWNGVYMLSSEEAWAVGASGSIQYYKEQYPAMGIFESTILDSGKTDTLWNWVDWSESIPLETALTVSVRTGPTDTPDESWSPWGIELTGGSGTLLVPQNQYLQYRLTLETENAQTTPEFHDLTVFYDAATLENLNAIQMLSSSEGWAVGNNGKILRWDGIQWSEFIDTGTKDWNSLAMLSSSEGWAVGDSGEVYHWDGNVWEMSLFPSSANLMDIEVLSTSEAWSISDNGEIFRWDGSSWSEFLDTGSQSWNSITLLSSTEGWIVGSGGEILRWDGVSWLPVDSPTSFELQAIHMISSSQGWAVGRSGTLLEWNGSDWALLSSSTTEDLWGIDMLSDTLGWVVGDAGEILKWNKGLWTEFNDTGNQNWKSIDMLSENEGWMVGDLGHMAYYTQAYKSEGTFESSILDTNPEENPSFESIFWTKTLPIETILTVATRTGNTPSPDESWSDWSIESTAAQGSLIESSDARYFQLRATFQTNDPLQTPSLNEILATYK